MSSVPKLQISAETAECNLVFKETALYRFTKVISPRTKGHLLPIG